MILMAKRLGHLDLAKQGGFTLVEVLVAASIITVLSGLLGGSLYQVLSLERNWRAEVDATRELRRAGSWFSGDALRAETTSLTDGAPAVSVLDLGWTGGDGVVHSLEYSLDGSSLVREFDGASATVARNVTSAEFSAAGQMLTFELEVSSAPGETKQMSWSTYMRSR